MSQRASIRATSSSPSGARAERAIELVLLACASVSVVTTLAIVGVLAVETALFFTEVSAVDFLTDTQWTPLFHDKHFGILPLVSGTFIVCAVALVTAIPMGLGAAIYLSEYARPRARRIIKPSLEILAGVPTIVYGYFALLFVTPLLQRIVPDLAGFNALSPGIVVGIMIVPMIASLSEDAIYAVPRGLREGALALGASRVRTVLQVVVPSAASGIAAAILLALARAIGETMIVAIAAGQQPRLTLDPRVPIETMTAYIVQVSMGDVPAGTLEYRTIFAVGGALFVLTFIVNGLSQVMVARMNRGRE